MSALPVSQRRPGPPAAAPAGEGPLSTLTQAHTNVVTLARERTALVAEAGAEQIDRVLNLADEMIGALTSIKLDALRAKEASGSWKADGSATFEAWRATSSGHGIRAAHRDTRIARDLGELPATADALAKGQITPEHAAVISRFRHQGHRDLRDKALTEGTENRLVSLAKRQDAGAFARSAARIGHIVDSAALGDEHEQVRARRYLRLSERHGGVHGEFFLDKIAGAEVRIALEAHTERPAQDDDRTSEQRAADALAGMANLTLDSGVMKTGALMRPHLGIIMTEDTLAQAEALRRSPTVAGGPPPADSTPQDVDPWLEDVTGPAAPDADTALALATVVRRATDEPSSPHCVATESTTSAGITQDKAGTSSPGVTPDSAATVAPSETPEQVGTRPARRVEGQPSRQPHPPEQSAPNTVTLTNDELATLLARAPIAAAELEDGTLVPPQVLARILCDSFIGRIVIDAEGQPIDLGQEQRTASGEMRLAILARDRTCRWPGCTRPARWSDYHHLIFWSRGGRTSIVNGIHLCRDHHETGVHRRGAIIVAVPGGFDFHWPDGSHIGHTDHATRPHARRRR